MNVPGKFALTDVTYRNAPELALLVGTQPGQHVALMGPAALSTGAETGLRETVAYSFRYRTAPGGALTPTTVTVPAAGSNQVTFGELVVALNTALAGVALVDINDNELRFTDVSAPLGAGSFIEIVDGLVAPSLFGSVPQAVAVPPIVVGFPTTQPSWSDTGLARLWFQGFAAPVAGVNRNLRWNKMNVTEQTYVAGVMNFADPGDTEWTQGTDSVVFVGATPQTALGLAAGNYTLRVQIDGGAVVEYNLAVTAGMTFQQLADDLLAPQLPVGVNVSMVANALIITSSTHGATSTVAITDGVAATPLLAALVAFTPVPGPAAATAGVGRALVAPATLGAAVTLLAANTYSFNVTVDGGAVQALTVTTAGGESYTVLAGLLNAVPVVGATVAYVDNVGFVVTSATTGSSSSVVVAAGTAPAAGGDFWAALAAADTKVITFSSTPGLPSAPGAAGVNGVAGTGVPNGLLAARPAQPQARGTLFYATDTFKLYWSDGANWNAVASPPALPSLELVLTTVPSPTGFGPLFTSSVVSVFETGSKPVTAGQAVNATMYYDGAAWKYFVNDALVGSVPPVINQL